MEVNSKTYRNRMIVIVVILIVSTIFGTGIEKRMKKNADYIDQLVETIQSIPAEEYEQKIKEKNLDRELSAYESKEKALKITKEWQDFYQPIYSHNELYAISVFSISLSGALIGVMMYYIFTGWILNKVFSDLKLWMSILMRTLVLIILLLPMYYVLVVLGVVGQLPFVIYTLYKFIKTRKDENKDDVLEQK